MLFAYLMLPIPVYNTIWILLIAYVTLLSALRHAVYLGRALQIHQGAGRGGRSRRRPHAADFPADPAAALLPVLLAAWIYVFVLAVRELGASVFLVGPGTHVLGTISLTMWEEGGSYGAVSALGVIQIIPLIMIVAGLRWLELRVQRRAEASAAKARIAAG